MTEPIAPKAAKAPRDSRALRSMDLDAMIAFMQRAGHPAYRARQIFQWVYEKGAEDFDAMTNLSKDLRAWLGSNCRLGGLDMVEVVGEPDETQKIVFRTRDGEFVESVLMRGELDDFDETEPDAPPPGSTPPKRKLSLCVSSQVGCPLACAFCMTGFAGFRRDLDVDEILDQALTARRLAAEDEQIANLVFMGMGEPLLNLDAVVPALRLLVSPQAFGIATRRITVSTAGVVPGIEALGQSGTEVNLAVSLNATTQDVRNRIMPGCRQWPLAALLDACRAFPLSRRRRITFEYVLLKGVNDTPADAHRLTRLLRGIPCKINLILYNADAHLPYAPTSEDAAEAFRALLVEAYYTVSLRRSKGQRHRAACGQLAAHARRSRKETP